MPELTPRIGLKRPVGTDNVTRAAYAENLDIIDAAVVRPQDVPAAEVTVNPASAPTGNAGTVGQLLGGLANRIKAITGAAKWWSTPATTLAATAQHIGAGGGAHAVATTSAAGFMSTADKSKLDGLPASAAPASHVGAGGTAHAIATTSAAGFMNAADKSKLNGIEAGATADMTASEILTAMKTVDGAGSGLDADLLQGVGLAAIPRRQLYVGDETEKSVKGTTATTVKSHKVVQCSSHGLRATKILVIAELKRDTSGTGYLDVYVDGSLAFTLSTSSASYALVKGSKGLSFSDDTIHAVDVKLRHSSSSYSTYNRLYECYVEVS